MEKIGEIISVESSFIVAEGSANMLPSLGSLIKTNDSSFYYFLVVSLFTESRTPGRIPIAYGKQIDVLKKEQPQIFELMKWGFRVVPVAMRVREYGKDFFDEVQEKKEDPLKGINDIYG